LTGGAYLSFPERIVRIPCGRWRLAILAFTRLEDSFPSTKDGREHEWASATVEHGEYKERLFVGCVGDKIIA